MTGVEFLHELMRLLSELDADELYEVLEMVKTKNYCKKENDEPIEVHQSPQKAS